ncbi:MAG: guanosine monophosphate reductase [Candidatus Levybacteria bacterium]|nr:guanosine monophosphate reductase [Candidatus Levybacteria bacterium]
MNLGLSYNDVLLVPKFSDISTRTEVDVSTQIAPDIRLKIPLISVNMDTVTGVEMAVALHSLGGIGLIGRFDLPDIQADKISTIKKRGAASIGVIGVKDDYMERAEKLIKAGSIALHLDIAHAHSTHALKVISDCKNRFPKISIIAGTIATYDGAYDLLKAGADSLKVGIGAGTTCITRVVTGFGIPQITAIMEADRARKKFKNKYILADSGAANSGDIVKALAAGADAYQGGSIFAGTDEAPGKTIKMGGKVFKEYNGSTSRREKERQLSKDKNGKKGNYLLQIEGIEGMVPYKGPVKEVVDLLVAGIKSGFSYAGAKNISEFHKNAEFIQITQAGFKESQPHDINIRN